MVQINFARREVNCKIVYYGPGLSGKTTNLEMVHEKLPRERCGKLTSIATEGDRTLFFDFMPISLGQVAGMNTKFQLYTVPGQTFYESTRRLVLQGADGVVFVADSQREKMEENIESFENLKRNLRENGLNIEEIPLVLQYNKRDMPDILDVDTLNNALNTHRWKHFAAVALEGEGIMQTLKAVSEMVLENLNTRHEKTRRTPKTTRILTDKVAEKAPQAQTSPAPAEAPAKAEDELVAASAWLAQASAQGSVHEPVHRAPGGHAAQREAARPAAVRTYGPRKPQVRPKTRAYVIGRNETPGKTQAKKSNVVWITVAAIGSAAALVGLLLLLFT